MGIGGLCGVGAGMMDKHTPDQEINLEIPQLAGPTIKMTYSMPTSDNHTPKLLDCIPTMRMSLASRDMLAALEAMRDHPTIRAVCPSPLWAQMVNAILKARGETA